MSLPPAEIIELLTLAVNRAHEDNVMAGPPWIAYQQGFAAALVNIALHPAAADITSAQIEELRDELAETTAQLRTTRNHSPDPWAHVPAGYWNGYLFSLNWLALQWDKTPAAV
ncbi:Uncharacterised protein [Mycobacteroides abscessus subsp. abscessus]|uniref:hypothetical protein n=1 Tax=Mycobacteroides abscessus TaxID=36809 RepID=UPI00092B9005|nr:hypothetical protein [Mycobacteroides abscessus]SHX96239.1 Uncharacterised protein [Mycobacteroides abscessus subsp. abscessus]SIC77141.1 Uncharacterised protein [Mycobacteroides abscessus subsp. abscessus]SKP28208.1 Uncharacterised protein [Mycobacteroides abscessus subsp. abscessus]